MPNDNQHASAGLSINRRTALGLGLAAGAAMSVPASAAGKVLMNPDDPEDARLISRKLRYRTDSGLLFSWIKGPYMAAYEGNLIPMYAINLGSISRVTQRPDGGFDLRDLEMSFRVDVETGRRLTSFRNPITNETVPVVFRPQGPNNLSVTRDNSVHIDDVPGGARFNLQHFPVRPFVMDNQVYLRDRTHATVTMPDGSVSMLNEVSTLSAPRAQVLDRATTTVESRVLSNDVRSWPAWLNMGNRPGTLNLFGVGARVKRFEDLPQDWLEMLHEVAPEIAKDPIAALDRLAPRQS